MGCRVPKHEDDEQDVDGDESNRETDGHVADDQACQGERPAGLPRALDLVTGDVPGDHGHDSAEAPRADNGGGGKRRCSRSPRGCSAGGRRIPGVEAVVAKAPPPRRGSSSRGRVYGFLESDREMAATLEDAIKRRLQAVPDSPGVYLFRDSKTQ